MLKKHSHVTYKQQKKKKYEQKDQYWLFNSIFAEIVNFNGSCLQVPLYWEAVESIKF